MPLRESAQQAWDNALQVIPSKYVIPPSQSVFPAGLLGSIAPPHVGKNRTRCINYVNTTFGNAIASRDRGCSRSACAAQ
jgi:hypothetical protein